jgi:hypothetical protein
VASGGYEVGGARWAVAEDRGGRGEARRGSRNNSPLYLMYRIQLETDSAKLLKHWRVQATGHDQSPGGVLFKEARSWFVSENCIFVLSTVTITLHPDFACEHKLFLPLAIYSDF